MKVLIIEDEAKAAQIIKKLLLEIDGAYRILNVVESIAEGIAFLKQQQPDLIISDIELLDGISFEIFTSHPPPCPVIFTTAYEKYAVEAFEHFGVDYVLKPIEKSRLQKALDKLKKLQTPINWERLSGWEELKLEKRYKSRFMIKVGEKIKAIKIEEIALFYSLNKGTFIQTKTGRAYVLDYTLNEVMAFLNPNNFFRVNRTFIVCIDAIQNIITYSNSRLRLEVVNMKNEKIIVARERINAFKNWLNY